MLDGRTIRTSSGRKVFFLVGAASAALLLVSLGSAQAPVPVTHSLTVIRHEKTDLTDARANQILREASRALGADDDGPGNGGALDDRPCAVTLARSGAVGTFAENQAPAVILTKSDWNKLSALTGWVKIVQRVKWCSGPTSKAIGCGSTPGRSFALTRQASTIEFKLWAHEFGHNTGLGHNQVNGRAIMNQGAVSYKREVSASECVSYRAGAPRGIFGPPMAQSKATSPRMRVTDFVRTTWVEGLPYEQARSYSRSDASVLLKLLEGAKPAPVSNIFATLAAIGDPRAVDPMIRHMTAPAGDNLTSDEVGDRTGIPISLGWLANRTGDRRALELLQAGMMPSYWTVERLPWVARSSDDLRSIQLEMAVASAMGLALAGRRAPAEAFTHVAKTVRGLSPGDADRFHEALEEAREIRGSVALSGLARFYASTRTR